MLKVAQRLMKRKKEVEEKFLKELSAESLSKIPVGSHRLGWGWSQNTALGVARQEQPPESGPELGVVFT